MSEGAEFFGRVKQKKEDAIPEGMTVHKFKRLKEQIKTQRYLDRGNSYVVRDPIEDHGELANLFRRGDLLKASELEAKRKAEEEAQKTFEAAIEDRVRDSRYVAPRPTTKDTTVTWTRKKLEE